MSHELSKTVHLYFHDDFLSVRNLSQEQYPKMEKVGDVAGLPVMTISGHWFGHTAWNETKEAEARWMGETNALLHSLWWMLRSNPRRVENTR